MRTGRVALSLLALIAIAVALHRTWLPAQWDPTQPLDLHAPPNAMTPIKLALLRTDPALCRAALATASLGIAPAPGLDHGACPVPDAVRVTTGQSGIALSPSSFLASCPLAVSWALLTRDLSTTGPGITRISHLGSYACRDVRNEPGRLSAHAGADAIDVSAFTLQGGRTIPVSHWNADDADAALLHHLRDTACRSFGVVLSPDYDRLHATHLHLQARGFGLCR